MDRYEKYKKSGIDWIGEIPEHWDFDKLGWQGDFSASGIDKKTVKGEPLVNMINYTDVYGNHRLTLSDDKKYMVVSCPETKKQIHQVEIGDLIFTPSSETIDEIGLSALVIKELPDTVYSYHVIRLQFTKGFDVNFRKYLCNNNFVLNQFSREAKGTTRQIIGRDVFKNIGVVIPPFKEQTAIANYLDQKTTEIDELINQKEQLLKLYEEEKTAIINQAVTKGINPDVKLKDSGINWLGEIPVHWEVKKLKYLLNEKLKYGANESALNENRDEPRYIRITDFGNNGELRKNTFKSLPSEIAEDYMLEQGDILFARSGATVGKTFQFKNYDGKACFAGYLIKASPEDGILLSDFLYLFTKSSFYERWKESIFNQATIQNIGADKYSFLNIPIPLFDEQSAIVQHIKIEIARINTKAEKTKKLIDLLGEYKQSLISEVVTGKIKVIRCN